VAVAAGPRRKTLANIGGGVKGEIVKDDQLPLARGNDILLDLPITIDEAVLGGKIEVNTVSGRVSLQIPKGTSSGRIFRLKGKGVRNSADGTVGDQLVTIRIVMPDNVDDTLSYFLAEWRQKHAYDPGRD